MKKSFSASLISLILTSNAFAESDNQCPKLNEIHRTPGEYSWTTTVPSWEGYFAEPLNAKGYSNKVKNFLQARWIQFTNLPSSPGYIQCDYAGDIGEEVIRFVQKGNKATQKPSDIAWTKVENLKFPSVQRECGGAAENCKFKQL